MIIIIYTAFLLSTYYIIQLQKYQAQGFSFTRQQHLPVGQHRTKTA